MTKKQIKRNSSVIPETSIICMYCKYFWTYGLVRTKKIDYRYCHQAKKRTTIDEEICVKYVPSQFFYCASCSCWLDIIVCLKRYKQEQATCVKCQQFHKSILEVFENHIDKFTYGDKDKHWLRAENLLPMAKSSRRKLKKRTRKE